MQFFTNSRLGASMANNRVAPLVRRKSRTSGVDFDRVPSPRLPRTPMAVSRRRSIANGSAAGPSNLSRTTIDQSPQQQTYEPQDDGGMDGGFDDYGPQEESPQRTSFTQMDQDDVDDDRRLPEEQDVDDTPIPLSKRNKGKGRKENPPENLPREDTDVEDEIAQGLNDVELEQHSDDEEEEQHRNKKSRIQKEKSKEERGRPRNNVNRRSCTFTLLIRRRCPSYRSAALPESTEGLRRGKRLRYQPLEWWRQEKVVYGRRESGVTLVPQIKEIRRVPKEHVEPLAKKHKRKRNTRSQSRTTEYIVFNPEEGWDADTPQQGVVIDFVTHEEVQRRENCFCLLIDAFC